MHKVRDAMAWLISILSELSRNVLLQELLHWLHITDAKLSVCTMQSNSIYQLNANKDLPMLANWQCLASIDQCKRIGDESIQLYDRVGAQPKQSLCLHVAIRHTQARQLDNEQGNVWVG